MIAIMSHQMAELLMALRAGERRLPEGGLLFHRGDPVTSLFLVLEGTIELVRHQADGGIVILQRASRNAVLAEASVFSQRYHCDAVAAAPSVVLAVSMTDVRSRLSGSSEFGEAWAEYLAREVQEARLRSEILSLRTVARRLDAWLLSHGDRMPAKGEWKSLAHQIGVSPEALYRELARRNAGPRAPGSLRLPG
jgi:CRP/FNR family transcriptional regulator, dissimilatory nitrate respiration regulator